jgi:transposase
MAFTMSRDEIRAIYRQGEEAVVTLIEFLLARINKLEADVARLKAGMHKDSHNSNKPPSSDMFRPPKSLRAKSDKPSGGQVGHEGHSLKQVAKPDHVQEHLLHGTCECGRDLAKGRKQGYERRQVFDVPKPVVEVTEHRAETRKCTCGRLHTADFPAGVEAPVQYGRNIRSMLVYLSQYQMLPQKRLGEAMADLFGVSVSEGTVNKVIQQAHDRLGATEEAIKEIIRGSPVAHGDETGIYVGGKRLWQHVVSTALFTYLFCHERRGRQALKDDGVLERFIGRLVHDGWMSYFDLDCLHALCNAHHLRELIFLSEECGQRWAGTMVKLLCQIKKTVDRAKGDGRDHLAPQTLLRYRKRYESILACGNRNNPLQLERIISGKRGRIKQTPSRNLLDRLEKYSDETLAFMYDFKVPFDNNTSERDLRMSKVKQKVSGCFRSMAGAQAFCRIRGYISTVRKHGLNVFDQIAKCFDPSVTHEILLPVRT